MEPVDALSRLGGVARHQEVVALSSRRRLRRAVARGQVRRLSRDRYALPTASRAQVVAGRLGGYASHLSAAAHWGWEIASQPEIPQLAVPRHRLLPETLPHAEIRRLDLQAEDIDGSATNRLQTVLHCARDLPLADALAVADSALRHGDLTYEQLVNGATALPDAHAVLDVVRFADGRAANPFESVLRAITIELGWCVVPQYAVTVAGVTYHPDLADPLRGVAIEADSFAWHGDKDALARDCVRYNALVIAGWRVLRFSWEQVMLSPTYVAAVLRELDAELCGRGPRVTRESPDTPRNRRVGAFGVDAEVSGRAASRCGGPC